jgi:hypothetical protein
MTRLGLFCVISSQYTHAASGHIHWPRSCAMLPWPSAFYRKLSACARTITGFAQRPALSIGAGRVNHRSLVYACDLAAALPYLHVQRGGHQ